MHQGFLSVEFTPIDRRTTDRPPTTSSRSLEPSLQARPKRAAADRIRAMRQSSGVTQPDPTTELARLRGTIDNIDAALVHMLAERFKCTQQVGELKARSSLPPADKAREERQISRLRALATDAGLDPVFAEKFLNFVIAEVIHHHERIAEGK